MGTVPKLSLPEKQIGALAELTGSFSLAYEAGADTLPRDGMTLDELVSWWNLVPDNVRHYESPEAPPVPEPRDPVAELPLGEWFANEASWYEQHESEGCDLIGQAIRRIADACAMHGCNSVAELMARSPLFSRASLEGIETPAKRPHSLLAGIIDSECENYLRLGTGDAARLVAWVLFELAEDVDFFHANSVVEFLEARHEFERLREDAAAQERRDDEDDWGFGPDW